MHLRLGQAARYHAQDKTPRHLPRRSRLHAQSDRLQPDPHSQIDRGIGEPAFTPPKASQLIQHTNRATDLQDRARLQFLGFSADCYVNPAPNFFRFNIDGAQMHMGLGDYIYNVKQYKKIATVGEDYSFIYTQVFGLALDYCPRGGQITKRIWVPLGTKDFASTISSLPDDVDAIYLGLGGADAINFLNQYQQAGGNAKLIGGSIMVDQSILSSKGKAKEALVGVNAAGPFADTWDDPKWQAFVQAYQHAPNEGYFKN